MRIVKAKSERKKEILEAATKIFLKKGFEKTSMEDIIAATSLSKGGFYHYYSNTTDILHDLMLEGIAYRIKIIESMDSGYIDWNDETVVQILVDKILDDSALMSLYVIYLQASQRNPDLRALYEDLKKENRDMFDEHFSSQSKKLMEPFYSDLFLGLMNAVMLGAEVLGVREAFRKNRSFFVSMMNLALEYAREGKMVN